MSCSSAAIRPAEGEPRLISAMRCRPGAASRSANGRAGGASASWRRSGVEQDHVAPWTGMAGEDRLDDRGILRRRAAGQRSCWRGLEPEACGVDLPRVDRAVLDVIDDPGAIERQLVDPGAMDHEG